MIVSTPIKFLNLARSWILRDQNTSKKMTRALPKTIILNLPALRQILRSTHAHQGVAQLPIHLNGCERVPSRTYFHQSKCSLLVFWSVANINIFAEYQLPWQPSTVMSSNCHKNWTWKVSRKSQFRPCLEESNHFCVLPFRNVWGMVSHLTRTTSICTYWNMILR